MSGFRLIAGKKGLHRSIREVNILDYEYENMQQDPLEADGLFHPGALVLASLLYAKEDPGKILPVFKQLFIDGCCAIAVKEIYYKDLPAEVLEFADHENFPIFMFRHTDMENIIYDIYAAINQQQNLFALESVITEIIEETCPLDQKRHLVEELIGNFPVPYHCEYILFPAAMDHFSYEKLFSALNNKKLPGHLFYPYRQGILTVVSDEFAHLVHWRREIPNHMIGIGNSSTKWNEFPDSAIESVSAAQFARKHQRSKQAFRELGIYKMLLPNQNNYWLTQFFQDVMKKIQNADPNHELWETAMEYVQKDMDVNQTAEALILHKNTVRYRIAKTAKIIGYAEEGPEFRAVLYLTVKWFLCNM